MTILTRRRLGRRAHPAARPPDEKTVDGNLALVIGSSLPAVLRERASLQPDDVALTFVDYDQDWAGVTESLTWSQLYKRASSVAQELADAGPRVIARSSWLRRDWITSSRFSAPCRRDASRFRWPAPPTSGSVWCCATPRLPPS